MRLLSKYNIILFLLFSLTLTFCTEKSEVNTDDPSNLVVEIVSIDHEIGFVQIQATADNATLYQLYIGSDETPEEVNNTGYFEYKFGGQGIYEFTIRAYGSSGRYVKKNRQVNVAFQAEEIPLNKGNFSPLEYTGYNLVWQNEFNGSQLNTDDWSYETGGGGWGNNELENYRPENAWVGDSVLTIEARMESYGGANYTSARIITKG
ncbi:MAG: hypothetical protein HOM80_01720, partial [Bacteroidetes bacterium]|nr:hypothetical protein [Bacteroidota bacterium]